MMNNGEPIPKIEQVVDVQNLLNQVKEIIHLCNAKRDGYGKET